MSSSFQPGGINTREQQQVTSTSTSNIKSGVGTSTLGPNAPLPVTEIGPIKAANTQGEALYKDPLGHLVREHILFRTLLNEATLLIDSDDVEKKRTLTQRLVNEISKHTSLEEMWLHDTYKTYLGEEGQRYYDETLLQDNQDKQHLQDLFDTSVSDKELWADRFARFKRSVVFHMEMEEKVYWPALQRVLPADVAYTIGKRICTGEGYAPTHPHPGGPSASLPAKIMQPVVGMIDRAADAMGMGKPPK